MHIYLGVTLLSPVMQDTFKFAQEDLALAAWPLQSARFKSPLSPLHPGGARSLTFLLKALSLSLHFSLSLDCSFSFQTYAGVAMILTFVFTVFYEYITPAYTVIRTRNTSHSLPHPHAPDSHSPPGLKKHSSKKLGPFRGPHMECEGAPRHHHGGQTPNRSLFNPTQPISHITDKGSMTLTPSAPDCTEPIWPWCVYLLSPLSCRFT